MFIDQYCNPLAEITLKDIQAQFDNIVELVRRTLRGLNSRHPSLTFKAGVHLLWPRSVCTGAPGVVGLSETAVCPHCVTKQPFMTQPRARLVV